MHMMKAE